MSDTSAFGQKWTPISRSYRQLLSVKPTENPQEATQKSQAKYGYMTLLTLLDQIFIGLTVQLIWVLISERF